MLRLLFCITLCLLNLCTNVHADRCPSIADLKTGNINGWRIVDSYDGTTLTSEKASFYMRHATQFVLVEWPVEPHTAIHCYYVDHEGSVMQAYLTKENLIPLKNEKWFKVSGSLQCTAGAKQCRFVPKTK